MNNLEVTPTSRERFGVRNRHFGMYRGVIEYNLDPLGRGRAKVRVPQVHVTEQSIETQDIPWAEPIHLMGGLHDSGSFLVPPVGSTVWVSFEQGDTQYPIYFGTWYKDPTQNRPREINTKTSRETGKVLPTRPISEGQWEPPYGPETPYDVRHVPYFDPTCKLIYKSQKGASFLFEDLDASERVKLIDRLGQVLVMSGGVHVIDNVKNAQRRQLREVLTGDPVPYTKVAGTTSTIDLKGLSGQGLKIVSSPNSEWVEIISKDNTSLNAPEASGNQVQLLLGGGQGVVRIVVKKDGEETARLTLNNATGNIDLTAKSSITINADMLTLLAEYIRLQGDVVIDGDLSVRGSAVVSGSLTGKL